MKQLKKLLQEGNEDKIMSYVRNNLAEKLDTYIQSLDQVPELQNDLLKLQIESTKRQKKLDDIIKRLGEG